MLYRFQLWRLRSIAGLAGRTRKLAASAAAASPPNTGVVNVFDRSTKRKQKNRAAVASDADTYDYLKDRVRETRVSGRLCVSGCVKVAEMLVDRVADISRFFPQAVDIGCGRGHIAKAVSSDLLGSLYQCDMAELALVHHMLVIELLLLMCVCLTIER